MRLAVCHPERKHAAFGLCVRCYDAVHSVFYRLTHKEERRAYGRWKYRTDLNHRLACNLRRRLRSVMSGFIRAGSGKGDLGCSIEHLKLHLELFWDEGMNWENYGHKRGQWSIDHIKPLSRFDLTDRDQFLEANHYLNLQPLWHSDNVRKGKSLA